MKKVNEKVARVKDSAKKKKTTFSRKKPKLHFSVQRDTNCGWMWKTFKKQRKNNFGQENCCGKCGFKKYTIPIFDTK